MSESAHAPVGPPAGWYPDPEGQPVMRWWDGTSWREQTQVAAPNGTLPPSSGMQAQTRPYSQGQAVASLVLGIVGVVLPVLGLISLTMGILAIVFGSRQMRRATTSGRGMAIAGFVLGIVGILLYLLIAFATHPYMLLV